jgi:hypothetical protein
MSLYFRKKIGISSSMDNLMDDDFVVAMELSLFASNIIKEICGVLDGFSLLLRKYINKIIYYF